jgi:bifunctional DNA-binding transcriptional regulator/antitoxin component of YhaV-PrlF toxin-antitoxin module
MAKLKETATTYSAETGAITVVSRQGRTEIPLALRRKYQIGPQAKLRWIDAGRTWIVVPLLEDPIKAARGMLKDKKLGFYLSRRQAGGTSRGGSQIIAQVEVENETTSGSVIASEAKQSPRCNCSQRWRLLRRGVYPESVEGFLAMTPPERVRSQVCEPTLLPYLSVHCQRLPCRLLPTESGRMGQPLSPQIFPQRIIVQQLLHRCR